MGLWYSILFVDLLFRDLPKIDLILQKVFLRTNQFSDAIAEPTMYFVCVWLCIINGKKGHEIVLGKRELC